MKTIIILVSLLAAVSLAAGYTPEQQITVDGVRLSFQLGQLYDKAAQGQDVTAFNALVEQWNTWVVKNFGNDTTLLMAKMTAPANLQKPYIAAGNNTTSNGIVHKIGGEAQYTTNDVNLMSDAAIAKYAASGQGKSQGADFLGGV
jgi:ABC-type hemin transport system substrate-binding protein